MSRFNLRLRVIAFAAICVAFSTISANGQRWKLLGASRGYPLSAYFWDTGHGVVSESAYTLDVSVFDTGIWGNSNGGGSEISLPLRFLEDTLFTTSFSSNNKVAYSTDSGWHWNDYAFYNNLLLGGLGTDIYRLPNGELCTTGRSNGFDGGTIAKKNQNIGIASWYPGYTSDGGVTWNLSADSVAPALFGQLGAYYDSCRDEFFVNGHSGIYFSKDSGHSWTKLPNQPPPGGAFDGAGGVLYIQNTASGVWRSWDAGSSWDSIGGPSYSDYLFQSSGVLSYGLFAFGTDGQNLIALDASNVAGNVWLYSAESDTSSPVQVKADSANCDGSLIPVYVQSAKGPLHVTITATGLGASDIRPRDTVVIAQTSSTIVWYRITPPITTTDSFKIVSSAIEGCITPMWDTTFTVRNALQPITTISPAIKAIQCEPSRFPLVISAPRCASMVLDSLTYDSLFSMISVQFQGSDTIAAGTTDTIWFVTNPYSPGDYTTYIHWHGSIVGYNSQYDTTIAVTLQIPNDSTYMPVLAAKKLSVSNCATSKVPIFLHAPNCDSIIFSSCALSISGTLTHDSSLNFPRILQAGEVDTLLILFPPQDASGPCLISAQFRGYYLGTNVPFDTTIQIAVSFTNQSAALNPDLDAIQMDSVRVCELRDTIVTFTNIGCDTLTVTADQTSWKAGWSADDPAFPIALPPDSSFTVLVHFLPSGPAVSNQNLVYAFESQGGQNGTSSQLTMTAVAIPAMASFSISDTVLNFGTFPRCSASADTSITITNTGCDSLSLSEAFVDGGNGFSLASGADTVLGHGEFSKYTILFSDSIIGILNSTLHIHGVGARGGNAIDTSVPLNATIVAGQRSLAASINAANLGSLYICQSKDTSITLYNKGCDTLTIDSSEISNSSYISTASFPIIIKPGDSSIVNINLKPSDSLLDGAITFSSNANTGNSTATVQLQANLLHPATLKIVLGPSDSAFDGEVVTGYVVIEGAVPADEISALHFDITHNDDILSFVSASGAGLTESGGAGTSTLHFTLSPVVGVASMFDTIGTLTFEVYLADSSITQLSLSNISFTTSSADISPDCIASIGDTGASFTYLYRCGNEIIQDAMLGKLPFVIESIVPNPASSSITVMVSGVREPGSGIEYEMFDVLGNSILTQHSALSTEHLDVSSLPSGIYYLRLSANGYVQSRQVVIER